MTASYESLAARLRAAYSSGPVPPLRDGLDPSDGAGGYAVQTLNTQWWETQGRRVIGRKIGLTAKSVQAQLGVSQPDFGVLFDDMRIADRGTLRSSQVLQAKVEGEIAFVFSEDLENPEITLDDLGRAIESVAPAIEIVDSRIADWKITFADTVADNGSSGYFVIGPELKYRFDRDLWSCGMVLEVNGDVLSLGAGAACLGHPLNAALWLARTLAQRSDPIRRGDLVLTGALGPMVPLRPGNFVRATIGGLGTAEFTCIDDQSQ